MSLAALSFDAALTPTTAAATREPLAMRLLSPDHWDDAVADFADVCQEQLYSFASTRWPEVALEPQLFMRNGEVVGGCLVMVQPLPLGLGAIAVVKWAPMLRFADRPDAAETYRDMISALVAEYDGRRHMMLSVLPHAALGAGNPAYEHLIARGFRSRSTLLFPNRYVVNLRLSDAEQKKSFHQKWRYHLNKADKAELTFERAEADRLGEFAALYEQMVDRKRFADHSAFATVSDLMGIGNARLRPELFFVRHEGEIVAGAIIFKAGQRAVYLYGATTASALELRAGYFLHWHIIRWLRDNSAADWYDLGGTDGFQGLHQFKKGMVGERGVIVPVPPVANYASRFWPLFLGEGAFAAREVVQRLKRRLDRLRPDRARPDQQRPGAES